MKPVQSVPFIEDTRFSSVGSVITLETDSQFQNTHYGLGLNVMQRYFELMDRMETNHPRGLPQIPVGLPTMPSAEAISPYIQLDIPDQFSMTYYKNGTLQFEASDTKKDEPFLQTSTGDVHALLIEPRTQRFFPDIDEKTAHKVWMMLVFTEAYYKNFNNAVDLVRFYRKKKLAVPNHIFPTFPSEAINNLRNVTPYAG